MLFNLEFSDQTGLISGLKVKGNQHTSHLIKSVTLFIKLYYLGFFILLEVLLKHTFNLS